MTKYAKTASDLCVRFFLWIKGIVLDSQSGQPSNGLISTTAENGRIKTMISREEAVQIIRKKHCSGDTDCNECCYSPENCVYAIAIEALSNERPKGRWVGEVIYTEIGEEHAMQECSHCGKVRIIDNFCPNCGADMRGEEE